MSKEVNIKDIPEDMDVEDYPDDTVFVFSDHDHEEDEWAQAAMEERRKHGKG